MQVTYLHCLGRLEPWDTEGLIVRRPEIRTPDDLRNRTIAAPLGSTSHYQLLYFLDRMSLRDSVIVRTAPPLELAALWRAGEIDGAWVWSPHLQELSAAFDAHTLITGAALSQMGAPIFLAYVHHPKTKTNAEKALNVTGMCFVEAACLSMLCETYFEHCLPVTNISADTGGDQGAARSSSGFDFSCPLYEVNR